MEGTYLNIMKPVCEKPAANIVLETMKNEELFLQDQEPDKDAQSHHFYLTSYWKP